MRLIFLILLISIINEEGRSDSDNLYELLGVAKDASVKEIRKAFKTLAVKLHPDKNKDDKEADKRFMKFVEAYEVLKDPEARRNYDISGETTNNSEGKPQYHSYSYYANEFGIYDDDPLIITLSKADYELNVLDKNKAWFINFYSPHCHHCHTLAPIWRQLAQHLEGVLRIAAVNCEEDYQLCHQLSISAYPTLLFYEKDAHLYEGEQYRASKTFDALHDFVLNRLVVHIEAIHSTQQLKQQCLLFLCAHNCLEYENQIKLAASLEGLLQVGIIEDEKLQNEVAANKQIVFWEAKLDGTFIAHDVEGSDVKEILDNILNLLPNPELLNEDRFKEIRSNLREVSKEEDPWLICFYLGTAIDLNLQLKRLPTLTKNINLGLIHCGKSASLCNSLHISSYPSWGILKQGGAFELHHGRDVLHEIVSFARDGVRATNLHALSPADFLNIQRSDERWFIDWYAPWCPPCRRLLPEMRKASSAFNPTQVQFGTIDCTLHTQLCSEQNVRAYPTTIFYGNGKQEAFHGVLNVDGIVEFVEDMLEPSVIALDDSNFIQLMRKNENEMWLVDFFAPWCGPCQHLAPKWRKLAKEMKNMTNVKIAQLDCVTNAELCQSQNVRSYPTIRMYPLGSKGLNTVALYNGHRDVLAIKSWIFGFLPPTIRDMSTYEFRNEILKGNKAKKTWLVLFYAPWCSHCVLFEPIFKSIAIELGDKIIPVKLNCESEREFCIELRVVSYPTVFAYKSAYNKLEIPSQDPAFIRQQVDDFVTHGNSHFHDEF